MRDTTQPAYLIVNADDYGYFDCVSRGILACAREGIVTATGVFATSARFDEHAAWLRDCDFLDAGVHLNLTDGEPLTTDMRKKLARWSGRFPGKYAVSLAILAGRIGIDLVEREWRAQIERCLSAGLGVRFLNSHEHVHMLPPLFAVARALAAEYGVSHVRFATAGGSPMRSPGAAFRNAVMKTMESLNRPTGGFPAPVFLGLEASGKLDRRKFERDVSGIEPGRIYELMCHPGFLDENEIVVPRLLRYHDWDVERRTLTDPAARTLLEQKNVRLVRYRDLRVEDGRLSVVH